MMQKLGRTRKSLELEGKLKKRICMVCFQQLGKDSVSNWNWIVYSVSLAEMTLSIANFVRCEQYGLRSFKEVEHCFIPCVLDV